ncbi:MAG: carboxylesterase/lipase family protein [Gemmataceae bacterium]
MSVVVETTQGQVGVGCNPLIFRGIPFAKPPIGDLRFKPPEPVDPWDGELDCSRFQPACAQNPDPLDYMWGEVLAPGSEDCLYLNVWTPSLKGPGRPVLVWIHGGAFIIGSGRWQSYEGSRLVQRGQIVLVTINYRLGIFGFYHSSRSEYARTANLGLLDQIAALKWVRDNITAFGGDPNNVTICGESAGAISVSCLLACPEAKGLFHRAICMSGAPSLVRSVDFAERVSSAFLRTANLGGGQDLLNCPTEHLLQAQETLLEGADFLGEMMFGPVVDGDVLPEPPLSAIEKGKAEDVALLTGTTLDEVRLWSLYNPILPWIPPRALNSWLRQLGLDPHVVRQMYREVRPSLNWGQRTMAILGDALFWLPQIRLAEAQARHRDDTRMYLVTWQSPVRNGSLGAFHAVDESLLFGNLDAPGQQYMVGTGSERECLSYAIQDAWIAFVRDGDPNNPLLPEWPAFQPEDRATMLLDCPNRVEHDPNRNLRELWEGLPFDSLRPTVEELPRIAHIRWFFIQWALVIILGLSLLSAVAVMIIWWLS